MKIGECYITERLAYGGTGYAVAPVLLSEGVALLDLERIELEKDEIGVPTVFRFTFQFLRPGKAEIRFAKYSVSDCRDIEYEDLISFEVENMRYIPVMY
ncbi:hypothetical protein [Parabacteroides sp.]